MRSQFLMFCMLPAAMLYAQDSTPEIKRSSDGAQQVFDQRIARPVGAPAVQVKSSELRSAPEVLPEFPGGGEELSRYLQKALRMPRSARHANVSGQVLLGCLIDADGRVHDPVLLRGVGFGCDEEAMRVVKAMPPWTPARTNSVPMAFHHELSIPFGPRTKRSAEFRLRISKGPL